MRTGMKTRIVKYFIGLMVFTATSLRGFTQDNDGRILKDSTIKISEVKTNTIRSDFGPAVVGDTLCFTSYSDKILGQPDVKLRKNAFYDLYQAKIDENGNTIGKRLPLVEFLTNYHDGPVAYCEKTGELFVTQSSNVDPVRIRKLPAKDTIKLRIIIAKRVNGKWTSITNFPYNNPSFSIGHPAISRSGDTLVFSSDRLGSFGETDLYYSVRKKGKWGLPVNMGAQINTTGKEEFSFIYYNQTGSSYLIFASNGRFGFGGLDIFYTKFPYNNDKIEHFDEPINTQYDDFGMIIPSNAGYGFLTSNRPGIGSDDIYKFTFDKFISPPSAGIRFPVKELYVFNKKTLSPISSALIRSCDKQVYLSDQVGAVEMLTKQNVDCEVIASKTGYSEVHKNLAAKILKKGEVNRDTIWMEPAVKEKITLKNIYYDYGKWDILPESAKELDLLISFMKENPDLKVELSSHTDSRGDDFFNLDLSRKRAESAVNYVISHGIDTNRIKGTGYGETHLLNRCANGVNCTPQEHRQNRRTEIYIPEYGKALDVVQTDGQYAGKNFENQAPVADKIVIGKSSDESRPKTENHPIWHSTGSCYLILRSFQTKAYAEAYLREIISETPMAQVVGESTPFRIGIKQSSYQEAQEAKLKFIGKYSDCWILR